MVVEGAKNRLAIECDGDPWHGAEQFENDMQRQRILERCGWRFWRIRGSEYYRNPEKALESLWRILAEMEIEPVAEKAVRHDITSNPPVIEENQTNTETKTVEYQKDKKPESLIKQEQKNTASAFKPGNSPIKRFENAIRSPFPDEYTPALSFLKEANRLEKMGAPKEQIKEYLELARLADPEATSLYLTRWEIIKKRSAGN